MKKSKLINIVLAALFAAMVFVLTKFVSFSTAIGYIHPGDSMIYLAATMLPTPYAMAAAGIGGAMADAMGGYWVYVPVTLIVKMLLAFCFTSKGSKFINIRNILAPVFCCGITVFGYFAFEIFYYGQAAYTSMIPNLIQGVASAVIFFVIAVAFDRAKLKNKLLAG